MKKFLIRSSCSNSKDQPDNDKQVNKGASTSKEKDVEILELHHLHDVENREIEIQSEEDTQDQKHSKKKRKVYVIKYNNKWSEEFRWVTNKNNRAFCKPCQKFIEGGRTHLFRHAALSIHKKMSEKLHKSTSIKEAMEKLPTSLLNKQILVTELKLCMFAVEHNLPFLLFEHLPPFLKTLCNDNNAVFNSLKCSRTKATGIINNKIGPYSKQHIADVLKNVYFSIIVDETTDVSVKKCLVIIVRYYSEQEERVKDTCFGLVEITDATAEGIFLKLQSVLAEYNVSWSKLIGFASDNASVMMGHLGGVKKKIQNVQPNIFTIGCLSHSCHLCASKACSCLPDEIESFARNIYNYFAHSPKRQSLLQDFQEFCELKPHKLLRPSQTRWLSLKMVVDRILEQWPALALFFQNEVLVDNIFGAREILDGLGKDVFKLYFTFLHHILNIITKINLEFQSEKSRVHKIIPIVSSHYRLILKFYMKSNIVDKMQLHLINPKNPDYFLSIEDIYLGAKSDIIIAANTISKVDLLNVKLNCLNFYIKLASELRSRIDLNDEVLNLIADVCNTSKIFNSENRPSLMKLAVKFPNVIENDDYESLNIEWRLVNEYKPEGPLIDIEDVINYLKKQVNACEEPVFPTLSKFLQTIISLPHGSASAERVFSTLKIIKSNLRNNLNITTCNNLLLSKELLRESTCYEWNPPDDLIKYAASN